MNKEEQISEQELQNDVKRIQSTLEYIDSDIRNVMTTLMSKPNRSQIPNLFEKLALFDQDLKAIKVRLKKILNQIEDFEKQLTSLKECDTILCDTAFLEQYYDIKNRMGMLKADYKLLKSKIILFTDGLEKNA
jgi:septal ring factor EnvC (AmiA/AmiB activator)